MRHEVKKLALEIKGFLSEMEGMRLYELAVESSRRAPCLEIGSYCGKSTLFLAEGCRVGGGHPLFAVDHHRGSEEQQFGQPYFDLDLFDPEEGIVNTLDCFMRNIRRVGLVDWVIPIVADSHRISRYWPKAGLSLLFIDGGHSERDAFQDYHGWSRWVVPGGYLCIHDIFTDPTTGGQAPRHVLEHAQRTGPWEYIEQVETLGILRRRSDHSDGHAEPGTPLTRKAAAPIRSTRLLGTFPCVRTDSWAMIGQDGGQSIDLGDRTLFVFSDTLFAALPQSYPRQHPMVPFPTPFRQQGIFLANSAGLSTGRNLRQTLTEIRYYTDDKGFPREILEPTGAEKEQQIRFWPEHGIFMDGRVYLYYLGIQTIDRHSIWGFRNLGVGLAVLDPETGECRRIRSDGDWCLWKAAADDFHFGVQVLRDGEDIYVFASIRKHFQVSARLARVAASRITDPMAYEYLCSPEPEWSHDLQEACTLGESGPEYSVSYNPYLGQYLMVYVDGYQKTLMLRMAERLRGPYSEPQRIIAVPHEPSSELIYLGFEHPEFRDNGGETIYLSYCQPHFTANSLVALRFQ